MLAEGSWRLEQLATGLQASLQRGALQADLNEQSTSSILLPVDEIQFWSAAEFREVRRVVQTSKCWVRFEECFRV